LYSRSPDHKEQGDLRYLDQDGDGDGGQSEPPTTFDFDHGHGVRRGGVVVVVIDDSSFRAFLFAWCSHKPIAIASLSLYLINAWSLKQLRNWVSLCLSLCSVWCACMMAMMMRKEKQKGACESCLFSVMTKNNVSRAWRGYSTNSFTPTPATEHLQPLTNPL
jgi:hypothetical protein